MSNLDQLVLAWKGQLRSLRRQLAEKTNVECRLKDTDDREWEVTLAASIVTLEDCIRDLESTLKIPATKAELAKDCKLHSALVGDVSNDVLIPIVPAEDNSGSVSKEAMDAFLAIVDTPPVRCAFCGAHLMESEPHKDDCGKSGWPLGASGSNPHERENS